MEKVVYTVDEVAELLGISRPTAYENVKIGKIPSIKIGRRVLVPKSSFDKWLADTKTAVTDAK